MRAVIGVTDNRWAAYLRDRPDLAEANFWVPSGRAAFRMLATGEPFLFKTHWPQNQLVGGGFYSGYALLTVREAWELFGEGNGVASVVELAMAIGRYRKAPPDASAVIGCVLLRDLFFVPEGQALDAPSDFAKNIVSFKSYDLSAGGRHVDVMFDTMLNQADIRIADTFGHTEVVPGPVFGRDRLVRARVGQQAFKGLVLTSYDRRCAITGNHIQPILQAAHIRPVAEEGQNRVDNGLLLRSDVHTLFDLGYLGINERYELQVSRLLREEWGNGREFYDQAGRAIRVPSNQSNRPGRAAIEWHLDTKFRH
jgi:putative restriction endonuclease